MQFLVSRYKVLRQSFLIICLLFFSIILFAYTAVSAPANASGNSSSFAYRMGGDSYDYASAIVNTSDNGYVVFGYIDLQPEYGASKMLITKFNELNEIEWQKAYGGEGKNISGGDLAQTSDGGYIVSASLMNANAFQGEKDIWVLKLDSVGDIVWQKSFGGSSEDFAKEIQETPDGNYLLVSQTRSFGQNVESWLVEMDTTGEIIWQRIIGITGYDQIMTIKPTLDGGYIAAGASENIGPGIFNSWLIKFNGNFEIEWEKTYTGNAYENFIDMTLTDDGGYLFAGGVYRFTSELEDVLVMKVNSTGDIVWQKSFGGVNSDKGYSVKKADDGYVIGAATLSFGAGDLDLWMFKVDESGNMIWEKSFGESSLDGGFDRAIRITDKTQDGGFIFASRTESFDAVSSDILITKVDENGDIADCPACQPTESEINTLNLVATVQANSLRTVGFFTSPVDLPSEDISVEPIYICEQQNHAPTAPTNPSPENGAKKVDLNTILSWDPSYDEDGDIVYYDVYFGTDPENLVLLADDQTQTEFDLETLEFKTTYYWKIVADDHNGGTAESDIWTFDTNQMYTISCNKIIKEKKGTKDNNINPGEKIKLVVCVDNNTEDYVKKMRLKLETDSPYVKILKKNAKVKKLNPGETKQAHTPFIFKVSKNAPVGEVIEFKVKLLNTSTGYFEYDTFSMTVQ